jgi:two-component system phosphate regulon response regulator PhoB
MAQRPQILIIEDEAPQREILLYNVEAAGYDAIWADNGEDGVVLAYENEPDVIILDWMMPKLSGIEACRQLRAKPSTKEIPIILLTARSEDADKVRGLEIGADDYVTKPYSLSELMARIKTQLRRHRGSLVGQQLVYDDIILDATAHRVYRDGVEIKLGPLEFRLLSTFLEKQGRVLSRDQLLDDVWGRDIYVDTRTVDVHVGRLRKALVLDGHKDPIRTIRGAGYALG